MKAIWKPSKGEGLIKTRKNVERRRQGQREAASYLIDRARGHAAGVRPAVFRELDGEPGVLIGGRR